MIIQDSIDGTDTFFDCGLCCYDQERLDWDDGAIASPFDHGYYDRMML